jgi:tetratricopeptide (TPR) repeat protein
LALAAISCIATPSSAQNAAARSAEIAELSKVGKYSEAIPRAQRLLADMERTYGPDHRDVAASLNNLGMIYGSTGRDTEAGPLYRRALAILEKLNGLDSAEVAPELNNLAALYQRQDAMPRQSRRLCVAKEKFEDRMPKTGLDRDYREWSRYHRPDNHGQLANFARAAASV